MMTDTRIQQVLDTNEQTLITQVERQGLLQKLSAKCGLDLSTSIESAAYERSKGVKPVYFKLIQTLYQQTLNLQPNRANQQLPVNNNGQFVNQQINIPQQSSTPGLNHPKLQVNHMINQQPRFPSQQSFQPRMTNPQSIMVNNQSSIPNQGILLRDAQKYNSPSHHQITYTSSPLNSNSTIDLSHNYLSQQQQITNTNLSGYLSQPSIPQNRYPNQAAAASLINPRLRIATTNLNEGFVQQSSSNNSNDVLHQFVCGNTPTNSVATTSMTNTPSGGDRLLQQMLLSNNDEASNKMSLQNRQSAPTIMSQPIRSASTTNSNLNPSVNSLRPSFTSQQRSPSASVIIIPTSTQTSNLQIQSSPNVTIQPSPLNTSNGPYSSNPQLSSQPPSVTMTNSSTPLLNNTASPINRSLGSSSISSPDEETINLIKFLKEHVIKLQGIYQKFINDGHVDRARNVQSVYQQMLQFINNPTYEALPNAKQIRDMLERASNRSQPTNPIVPPPPVPLPQQNEVKNFAKALTEYISRDKKKRHMINKLFVEPLSDVINGVPHKKIRLDVDKNSNRIKGEKFPSLFLSHLNDELNFLPENLFLIERFPVLHSMKNIQFNEEYLNKNGIILRCKLFESSNPLIPSLRLRISTRYPEDQPEILSLTKTMPPKLEYTDGHPFFEQLSTIFVSYLFKLPSQHTVTDILNIWHQSVQAAV